jgi:hypothetical protein
MKSTSVLLLLFIVNTITFAQTPNCNAPTPYSETAHEVLKNLDKSQIPTGILYQEVFPWADIDAYDGSVSSDTSTNFHFFQAYSEIFYSSYDNGNMLQPSDLEQNILNFHTDKNFHHAIGILDYNFNSIKYDAVDNNLLYVSNGHLYDVPNRSISPYETKRTFITGILQANSFENFYNGTHYFYFQPNFTLSNKNTQLSDYQYIDFYLDGSFVQRNNINSNNSLTISMYFPQYEGESTFTMVYHKLTGEDEVSRIKLSRKIQKNFTTCDGATQIYVTGDSFDGGYGTAPYGSQGRGYVFFANNNCASQQIKKPIIFVDGFDPTNSRDAWSIWEKRINLPVRDKNGIDVLFGNELRSNGYDIIIYDYDEDAVNRGGGGFVENNGIAFAKFLETVRNQYGSTLQQDFIVIAPSMAALVVRYGLAWAEQNNKAHHVALYMSFDGPHQGANVTSGIQQMVDLFTQYGQLNVFESIKNGIHQTNAAKQMLLNHSSQESETMQAHPYRQIFLNNLSSVGSYPQNLRKIAIVDGNRNGILKSAALNGYNPCDDMFQVKIKRRFSPFCWDCDKLNITTFAQSDANRCKSSETYINSNADVLQWLLGRGGDHIDNNFTYYSQPVFTNKSFDKAPGSKFGPEAEMEISGLFKTLSWIFTGQLQLPKNLMPQSNFVPSYSAIDYAFPNGETFDIYKGYQGITLSKCAGTTPFDTVYALESDYNHARIDKELLEVFRNEIYNLKSKSICAGGCPEYVNISTPLPNGTRIDYQASKAICLLPNFKADNTMVISAKIGCENGTTIISNGYFPKNLGLNTTFSTCPFTWNQALNQVICNSGYTNFKAFVTNMDINTYAEFSINGVTWQRANIGDKGFSINLPTNSGTSQVFYARPKNNPTNTIQGWLGYCN